RPAGPRAAAPARRRTPRATHPARGTAGRQHGVPSPDRSGGTSWTLIGLPSEESRCLLEDLPLLPQHPVLAAQPPQLLQLAGGQPVVAVPRIQIGLLDPDPQALLGDIQVLGDLGYRLVTGADQPDRFS